MSLLQVEAACCCKLNLRQLFSTISRVLPDLYIVIIAFAWTKVFIIIPISILTLKDTTKPVQTTNINFNKSKIFVAWKLSMTLSTYRLSVCMTSLVILFVTRPSTIYDPRKFHIIKQIWNDCQNVYITEMKHKAAVQCLYTRLIFQATFPLFSCTNDVKRAFKRV